MIVQRRISMKRNKTTTSFALHKIEKRKMQKCILLIIWSLLLGDGGFEIEYVFRKETEILVKQIFTFFSFVFHLNDVIGFIIEFYHIIVITLLT